MRSLRAFFLFSFFLLSDCASSPAQLSSLTPPSEGKAVIYIYRVDLDFSHARIAPNVRVNNKQVGALLKYGYLRVEVDSGPSVVSLSSLDRGDDDTYWRARQDAFVNLNLAPDSSHFVQFSLDKKIFFFRETSRDTALRSLPNLHSLN